MMAEPEVTHRRPAAKSFAELQSGAPPKPLEGMHVFLDEAPRPDDTRPPEASVTAGEVRVELERVAQAAQTRFGMLEERVEKSERITAALEDVVEELADGGDSPPRTVLEIVTLAAKDGMLTPVAALQALARVLGVEPVALRSFMKEASGAAVKIANGIGDSSPPRRATGPAYARPKKAARKAKAPKAAATPKPKTPALTQSNLKAAGFTQGDLATEAKLSGMTVGRYLRGGGDGMGKETKATLLEAWRRLQIVAR